MKMMDNIKGIEAIVRVRCAYCGRIEEYDPLDIGTGRDDIGVWELFHSFLRTRGWHELFGHPKGMKYPHQYTSLFCDRCIYSYVDGMRENKRNSPESYSSVPDVKVMDKDNGHNDG